MLGATHGKIGLAVAIAVASAAIGCLDSANVSVWDPHDVCAKAPKSYEALPPEVSAADQNGQSVPESDPRAAVVVRIERRDCMFRANVTKGVSTGLFGPYESILPGRGSDPGGGGFVIVGRRPKVIGVTVNGVQDPTHEDVGRPMISRNGQHVAYLAQDGEETSVWVDGKWAQRGKGATALDQLWDPGRRAGGVPREDGGTGERGSLSGSGRACLSTASRARPCGAGSGSRRSSCAGRSGRRWWTGGPSP